MGFRAWDCWKFSFQSLCLCHCLCLCHRICHCHCHCICVTLPSLNSSCHQLSENVWVWGRGTVRCAAFNLFVFVTVFVFVIVFVIVIVIVLVSRCRLWIALVTSFQKMYGFGGVGLSEVQNSISELSVVGGWWWTGQTHFMVGPGRGPTKIILYMTELLVDWKNDSWSTLLTFEDVQEI